MHAALGDDLAVKVSQLFQEPDILQQHRAARASCQAVLIVSDGGTSNRGQRPSIISRHSIDCSYFL